MDYIEKAVKIQKHIENGWTFKSVVNGEVRKLVASHADGDWFFYDEEEFEKFLIVG